MDLPYSPRPVSLRQRRSEHEGDTGAQWSPCERHRQLRRVAGGTVEAPLDRTATPLAPVAPNVHALLPQVATIKEGGSVNFILGGFHQVVVYAPGKKPENVDQSVLLPLPGAPPTVGLIDDPAGRIYRGLDPRS